ncbi:hypothetical protein SanaruYs_16000 [Chryseotalea sanaruensis]|uniref:Yip1 domain-containing protein n=1 Tax=Chryseotalea sanaruensis TaxID=2482724 RepID=A0A401U915_9BACT|nr:hypothetical protein [Chryseotalea sanaruensis]GCC51375.1 hypothetical protein SanaruYs_16000 [Chryseotalea sanaruensis]
MMPNWKITLPLFLLLLFITRYYDFFYLYLPVRSFTLGGDYEPTMYSFVIYNYLLKLLFYIFKFLIIAIILSGGIFLEGNTNKTQIASLKELISLAILGEFVFFIEYLTKFIYLTFIYTEYRLIDYENFYLFSLYKLFDIESTSNLAFLFQTLNIFECGYIIVLIYGMYILQFTNIKKSALVVLYSYGSMLVIWILVMTYFKL